MIFKMSGAGVIGGWKGLALGLKVPCLTILTPLIEGVESRSKSLGLDWLFFFNLMRNCARKENVF